MTSSSPKPPTILLVPYLMIAFGVMLMLYMVIFEGELGAVPLLLLAVGAVWAIMLKRKANRAQEDSSLDKSSL